MPHIVRRLFRSPMFTVVTLVTLAIGIGANTAVFSVVEGVLLKPLPYAHPDELVSVVQTAPGINIKDVPMSPACYFIYREQGRAFQDIGMWTNDRVSITGVAEPEQVPALDVTDGVLGILGVQPVLGRSFTRQDAAPGSPKTVMLSYGYWQRKFGGDRGVLGRTIRVDSEQHQVIGVLPPKFRLGSADPALLLIFQFDRTKTRLGNFSFQSIARLKPGFTITQASADIARLIPVVFDSFAPPSGVSSQMFRNTRLAPNLRMLKQDAVGDIGNVLWVLMGAIAVVLVVACANVANLLLVRAEGRRQELAIRAALGAAWGRIARDLLSESVALGVVGGALGLAVAWGALQVLVAMAPAGLPRLNEIGLDGPVLLFAIGVSLVSGVLFGLIPIFKYAGPRIAAGIRHGGRTISDSRERHRARSTLVVVQVALALVLLIASGLMIRTFDAMRHVQPGFTRPEEVQLLTISIPEAQVKDPDQVLRMEDSIRQKIAQIPGVNTVAFAAGVTMDGSMRADPIMPEDQPYPEGKLPPVRRFKFASPGFLHVVGNPVVAGRDFTWDDTYQVKPVAIVTDNLAREYWKTPAAAIGKRIRENLSAPWREIIGVTGNERDNGVDHPAPTTIYWPMIMRNFQGDRVEVRRTVTYAVRSARTGSQGFVGEIQQAVWSVNPELPLANVRTLQDLYTRSMARTSFMLVMLAVAGGMALLLGVIGIYGVLSYAVSQRRREIGIRMALGAQQQALTRMFVREGLKLAAIGLAFGLAAAFALTRAMSALLFGVSAADPATYAAVSVALTLAAALASYAPSRRVSAVDPVEALRSE